MSNSQYLVFSQEGLMDAKMATRLLEFTLYLGRPHTNVWEHPSLESVSTTGISEGG